MLPPVNPFVHHGHHFLPETLPLGSDNLAIHGPDSLHSPPVLEVTRPSPLFPQPPHLPGAPQHAGAAVHPLLHEMPQSVEHHEVERDSHESKEDAEEAGAHRAGAQVAIA